MIKAQVQAAYALLKYTYGLASIAVGVDKIVHLFTSKYFIVDWIQYVHPKIITFIPGTAFQFLYVIGLVEILAGIIIFTHTRLGAYLMFAWLLAIIANLAAMKMFFDIIARDAVMASGALALAWLDSAFEEKTVNK